jgi:hypothetical protein
MRKWTTSHSLRRRALWRGFRDFFVLTFWQPAYAVPSFSADFMMPWTDLDEISKKGGTHAAES